MNILIISDIHANLLALEAVLKAAPDYDAVWCLGDLVGYGPNPNECVERVRALPGLLCLVGNHDKAVLGEIPLEVFNHDARAAIRWTQGAATPETLDYLSSLKPADQRRPYTLAHASPRQPVWEYILDCFIAEANFPYFDTPYCLVGHSHVPVIYREDPASGECHEEAPDYGEPRQLCEQRLIINPGSVGQPRDGNAAAAYAFLDLATNRWEFCRVAYDLPGTQARMRQARLPDRLIARLAYGW